MIGEIIGAGAKFVSLKSKLNLAKKEKSDLASNTCLRKENRKNDEFRSLKKFLAHVL